MNARILAKRMQLDLQKLFAFILASIFRGEQNNSVPHVCRQGSTQRGHVEVSHTVCCRDNGRVECDALPSTYVAMISPHQSIFGLFWAGSAVPIFL